MKNLVLARMELLKSDRNDSYEYNTYKGERVINGLEKRQLRKQIKSVT